MIANKKDINLDWRATAALHWLEPDPLTCQYVKCVPLLCHMHQVVSSIASTLQKNVDHKKVHWKLFGLKVKVRADRLSEESERARVFFASNRSKNQSFP